MHPFFINIKRTGVLMKITLQSYLSLVAIEFRKDKKHYIVEDLETGEFYEMPEVCIEAIKLIENGMMIGEIEDNLKMRFPNEDVDLLDFAQQLFDMDLIDKIDGVKVDKKEIEKESLGFLWISSKVGKFFFNKFSLLLYVGLFIVSLGLLIAKPSLLPNYQDVFISDVMVLNLITFMGVTFSLVLVHEFGHILAMRAYNFPTKLGVGHRLLLVVLETDMTSVWRLPSKDRNVLYLAGMCFDTVILFIALVSKYAFPNSSGFFLSLITLAAYDVFVRIIYQCCVYMKTDLYYVFENVSGVHNLMENAQQMIRNRLPFLKSTLQKDEIFIGEKNIVFTYSIFYFIGVTVTLALMTIFYIPVLLHAAKLTLPKLMEPPSSFAFWDAVLFSSQTIVFLTLLMYSWRKKYSKKQM
jgi:putative peptide zinc metalloprotease protein